jgi:hypothetical protein
MKLGDAIILNVISQQAHLFIIKIHIRLAASCALVAVKCSAVKWSTKVRTSPYIHNMFLMMCCEQASEWSVEILFAVLWECVSSD